MEREARARTQLLARISKWRVAPLNDNELSVLLLLYKTSAIKYTRTLLAALVRGSQHDNGCSAVSAQSSSLTNKRLLEFQIFAPSRG